MIRGIPSILNEEKKKMDESFLLQLETYHPLGVVINFSILFPNTARLRLDPCLLNVPSRWEYFKEIFNFRSPDGDSMGKIPFDLRSHSRIAVSI
jgi:hypothetical protein